MAKEYEKECALCGETFIARSHSAKYCPECRDYAKIKRDRKYYAEKKNSYYKRSGKSIREIMRELQQYNREHKTNLTYGQYVQMIEGGHGNEK